MLNRKNEQGFIIILIPIIIIVVLVILFSSGNKDTDKTNDNSSSSAMESKKSNETMSQSDAELYCQDISLLGKYIDTSKVSVIDASNYNVQYQDDGATYDKDGYPIKDLQWTGKDKRADKDVRFNCWISGPKDKATLHWLSLSGMDLYGTANFESYDKDGKLIK
jgi:hypothetical protein